MLMGHTPKAHQDGCDVEVRAEKTVTSCYLLIYY